MSYQVRPVNNKQEWEDFLLPLPQGNFMQSWNNGNLMEAMGEKVLRLGVYENKALVGVCLLSEIHAKRGKYLSIPYGPVFKNLSKEPLKALVEYLKDYASKQGLHFIRLSPYLERTEAHQALIEEAGFCLAPIHLLSENHWKLDLSPSEDELMASMKKNHRNLIRRAMKDGVEVTMSTSKEAVDQFVNLHEATRKRHDFVPFPNKLFYEQVKAFQEDDQVSVFQAKHEGKVLAAAIVMSYGTMGSYHHGASIPSKVPASYLLQWTAIQEAKKRGCKEYNFWGIVETDDKNHPFYGITHFKKGFGGLLFPLVKCHDLVLSPWYRLTYLIETIRRIKRGFGIRR